MYDAVAIDDSPEALINLISTLSANFADEIRLVGTANNVDDGLNIIMNKAPHIVFFDVELGKDKTCFDILNQISDPSFFSVFVTGFEHYAIKAFDFAALDYIIKPASVDDLRSVLDKIDHLKKKSLNLGHAFQNKLEAFETNKSSSKSPKKIVLNTESEVVIANIEDIIRCESDKGYTTFYLKDQKVIVSKVLKEYAEMLTEYGFFRPHKSHL
ncbi:MAG: LytTR family DNA-binding domain-containing protein, partial [Flavobacteriales bacterium]|nr:LytTR family DNA-binding domain-containing protein [Flavobacteriales bacterium]